MAVSTQIFTNGLIITPDNVTRYLRRDIQLPSDLVMIEAESFSNKRKINSVCFPDSLRVINGKAFFNCTSLKEVHLPKRLVKLGIGAFARCLTLEKATLSPVVTIIPDGLFAYDAMLKDIIIPSNSKLKVIRPGAFINCNSLTSLILPNSVQRIHSRAFYRCKNLETFPFPKDLKYIGEEAFYFCGFPELNLPDTLEYIEKAAFFKCTKLISVVLPPSVKHIGSQAFHGCNRLKYLEIRHNPEFVGKEIINRQATIRCYKGSVMDKYCQDNELNVEYLEEAPDFSIWK